MRRNDVRPTGPWLRLAGTALVVSTFLSYVPAGVADSATVRNGAFVMGRWDTAAVVMGPVAYIYQGFAPPSETAAAFSYNPATDSIAQLGQVYPGSRQGASAATNGVTAWTFGGEVLTDYKKDIIQHTPGDQGGFTTLTPQLPTGRSWTSAAWAEGSAYVFGGQEASGSLVDDVVRYDPAGPSVTVAGHLPSRMKGTAAAAVDRIVYVFGGVRDSGVFSDDIIRFDPFSGAATLMGARLPSGREGMSAATDGERYVYLFGGCASDTCNVAEILRYDTASDRLAVMDAELPAGRGRTSAVWINGHAYVFGGQQGADIAVNQIVRYTPDAPNEAPQANFEITISGLRVNVNGALSTDPEDDLVSYEWDWGDASPTTTGLTAAHSYATAGTKTIRLTVTDDAGEISSIAASVTLSTSAPPPGGGGGPVVIWYPPTSGNATAAPSGSARPSNESAGPPSQTPELSRVDPLAPQGTSPGAGVAALACAASAAAFLRRRR